MDDLIGKRFGLQMDRLISLQAAIDVLHMDTSIIPYQKAREYVDVTIEEIRNRLEKLPSVQPEREPAKFIRWMECKKTDKYISYTPHCKCSKCGNELLIEAINYCYMCGAKMEGERRTDEPDK